jgi:hypothetical protein
MRVDFPGGPQPPPSNEIADLVAHGGGVAGHPPRREQRLQKPLLPPPLVVPAGQQPVAEGAAELAIDGGVLPVAAGSAASTWCAASGWNIRHNS